MLRVDMDQVKRKSLIWELFQWLEYLYLLVIDTPVSTS